MARQRYARRFGRMLAALGVVLALGGWAVIPFASYVQSAMDDYLGQRCLSLLYDKHVLRPQLTEGWISWDADYVLEVASGRGDGKFSWCTLYYRLSEEDLEFKRQSVESGGGVPLAWVRFGEAVIVGMSTDNPNVSSLFAGFDPANYPVSRAAVTLALNKEAASDWRWTRAMSWSHPGTALLMAPVTGFSSLARLAARPVLQACPAAAAVLRYPALPVLGIGLALWGLVAARRPGSRPPASPPG